MMLCDGWVNTYERKPDVPGIYLVEDHAGHRFKCEAVVSKFTGEIVWFPNGKDRGYDICWWKERSKA